MPELHPDFLTKPMAHRGLHGDEIPENSRAAFSAAIDAGYGIELDLQLTADDQAIVFHDYDLERLTGTAGPIRMKSREELKKFHLSNGEPIPTLAEILALVDGRTPILVELKDQDGALGPNIGILEESIAAIINAYDGPLAVMSFNPHSVLALKKHLPNVARGLVTSAFAKLDWPTVPQSRLDEIVHIPDFEQSGAHFLTHGFRSLTSRRVAELKATGVPIFSWTIKSPEDEAKARLIADNITFEGYLP